MTGKVVVAIARDAQTDGRTRAPEGRRRSGWGHSPAVARSAGALLLLQAPECCVDLGGQEVEVGLVRLERVKAESFPPGASGVGERGDDDGSACGPLVEVDRRGENVGNECGPDPEARISVIDRQPTEQQRRDRVRRTLGERYGGSGPIDPGHGDAGVCHHDVVGVGDDPGGGGIAAPILAGVAAQPVVKYLLPAVEVFAVVSARVERCRAAELSQAS